MTEYERNQMTPDDVAKAIADGAYMRKNGDTSSAPKPKNESYCVGGMLGARFKTLKAAIRYENMLREHDGIFRSVARI